MIRGYLFALEPTPKQVEAFRSHCGAQRFAYNWGLAFVKANLNQRSAERTYSIPDDQLTPAVSWSSYSLTWKWNRAKHTVAPWWSQNSKHSYQAGLINLATALSNWSRSNSGVVAGRRFGFPTFKSSRTRLSCRFWCGGDGSIRLATDRRHLRLPKLGFIRTGESTRKLARRIERGHARILAATLSFQRGRWYVSFEVMTPDPQPPIRNTRRVVGVDVGIKSLAVLSTGEIIQNPRYLRNYRTTRRRLERRCSRRHGPDRRTGQQPSTRWTIARAGVNKLHARVVNQRRENAHRITTSLVRRFDFVVIEDLNVAGMARNRRLSSSIYDAAMAELRRQLVYKCDEAGITLIIADRWYPSSKTCSGCGVVKTKLRLSERTFHCESCGISIDRDLNAARNLAALADQALLGELRPEVKRPDGNPRKTSLAGNGYRHGKTPDTEPTSHREVMTP